MGELSLSQENNNGRQEIRLDMGSSLDMKNADSLAGLLREAVSYKLPVVMDVSDRTAPAEVARVNPAPTADSIPCCSRTLPGAHSPAC